MKSAASAPGKVILFGEHFVVHGTGALLCAIDMMTHVTAQTTDGDMLQIESDIGSCSTRISEGDVPNRLGPLAYIARERAGKFGYGGGIRIDVKSQIRPGAGLGSSSACCVAAAHAVTGLFSECGKDDTEQLALAAERTSFAGASGADTAASIHGGILRFDSESGTRELKSESDLSLVVADSGIERDTDEIVAGVGKFCAKNSDVFSAMCKSVSDLLLRAERAVGGGDLRQIGACMGENQSYLEDIGVSNETIDEMIKIADRHGYGSKITGAGGGGCIISAVPPESQGEAIKAFSDAGYLARTVKIDRLGVRV